jgi:hypothetical protein
VKITPMREKIFDSGHFASPLSHNSVPSPRKNDDFRFAETIKLCGMDLACENALTERSFGAQNSRDGFAREVRWGPVWKDSVQRSSPKLPLCH